MRQSVREGEGGVAVGKSQVGDENTKKEESIADAEENTITTVIMSYFCHHKNLFRTGLGYNCNYLKMFFKNPRTFFFLSLLLLRLPVGLELTDDDEGIGGVFVPLPWPLL